MVIEFKGKALGLVCGVIRDHELTWPQAYLWYVQDIVGMLWGRDPTWWTLLDMLRC